MKALPTAPQEKPVGKRMQNQRFQDAVPHFSLSCFPWKKVAGLLFVICTYIMDAPAFRIQRVASIENCQDHTMYFKRYFALKGEPVILKCPSFKYTHLDCSSHPCNLTWSKNDSKMMSSGGDEKPRIWAQDDALWFLPASLEDSGQYICTRRNSSDCADVSIYLSVIEKTAVHEISYHQILFTFTAGKLVCPDLEDFRQKETDLELNWYKDSVPLDEDNKKFKSLKGTHYLYISSVSSKDSGYYTCEMSFTSGGTSYNITRTIQLQTLDQEKRLSPVIVYPDQKATLAALGSKLILPCKVFIGSSKHFHTVVVWLANDTYVDITYKQGRVTEGEPLEIVENDENYIEVPLIFDPVREMDFYTDFKCEAQNSHGRQVLPIRVRQGASSFPWHITAIPVALTCLILGGLCMHKCWKRRAGNGYAIAKL
ncbi:interleukin-1 receptor type 2 isoform X1 [Dermochelys coriacea]|uniref:interleukin-1 receptor type 2 isoform X1 n=1 Tax=Dermochelys coriacea TaxID=27794 RepID=UPI0018E6FCAF|nr:interleukin-1 receptor type 2 isoform X1 [Dermochelys coriacea]